MQVDRTAWEKRFKESQCWLAIRNGELAGFGNVEYDGHLDMLFTDPRHQRCGVATALLKWLELAVVKMDIPVIYTEASITAKPFFIRHGFQLVEAQQVSVRGQSFINYRLRKVLM
ncbi:GNAT family N-acetyltransferase [Erwinia sp. MYb416]|uniref:GNAT family N-acetyltransferase n=1 Tax=Erwinia sp. MYb416 TaxID=3108532 RepID=UPI0030B69DAA